MEDEKKRFYKVFFVLWLLIISLFSFIGQSSCVAKEPICYFVDDSDYKVVFGKPRQVLTPFQAELGLAGPTNMVTIGVFCQEGAYEVYAYEPDSPQPVLYRYRTDDFVHYTDKREVLRLSAQRQWLGFRSMVKRSDQHEYLLMAAEKVGKENNGLANGIDFFISHDGIEWHSLQDHAAYHDHDMGGLIWCPEDQKYAVWQITYQPYNTIPAMYQDQFGALRRVLSVRASIDGFSWKPDIDIRKKEPQAFNEAVFTPDDSDSPDAQFYGVQLFPYANRFLAAVQMYAPSPQVANPNQNLSWDKRNITSPKHGPQGLVEAWIVRNPSDLTTIKRTFRGQDFTGHTAMNRLRHAPVLFHGKYIELQGQGAFSLPQNRIIGLYSQLNAIVDTPVFTMPSGALTVNATTLWHQEKHPDYQRSSYIMAEAYDSATGTILPGYEKEHCVMVNQDSSRILLKWGTLTTSQLQSKQVFLRFYFRDATIFSIEENESER